jgi:molybdopterin-biosynthesis enzyme MoeA-like protein
MHFGLIIIGDEILTGKRQDKHLVASIDILAKRGLELSWCEYIGDHPDRITATLTRTMATSDIVFCFGGIGATPDDYTRACAAEAAGVELQRHPDAVMEIRSRFGDAAYPHRVLMADLPEGSHIIVNPFNRIPGFSLHSHHFLPGFPEMAWPMMENILDTLYPYLHHLSQRADKAIIVSEATESQLLELMNYCVSRFPDVKLFSLPQFVGAGRRIELGVRGDRNDVPIAMEYLKQGVSGLGFNWIERDLIQD